MKEKTAGQSLWTWKFFVLILINLTNGVAGYMTIPLVAKYALEMGADLTAASSISGILSLVAMVMCPVAGVLSDRVNRKKAFAGDRGGVCGFSWASCLCQ